MNYTTQDGKSNWLEGVLLMCLYLILAVMFWYYPGELCVYTLVQSFDDCGRPRCLIRTWAQVLNGWSSQVLSPLSFSLLLSCLSFTASCLGLWVRIYYYVSLGRQERSVGSFRGGCSRRAMSILPEFLLMTPSDVFR